MWETLWLPVIGFAVGHVMRLFGRAAFWAKIRKDAAVIIAAPDGTTDPGVAMREALFKAHLDRLAVEAAKVAKAFEPNGVK